MTEAVTQVLLVLVPLVPLLTALTLSALALAGSVRAESFAGGVVIAATAVSLLALLPLAGTDTAVGVSWLTTGSLEIPLGFETTQLTWFTAMLVAAVSLVIVVYSVGYTAEKAGRSRYFAELSFFVGSMLALVLADSLLVLFAAWEFVGVASFLLIGFHFREPAPRRASVKAFVVTRFGDLGFLLAWLLLLNEFQTVAIDEVLSGVQGGAMGETAVTVIALMLFLAAVGKSAQLPLTAWLPEAMAGPTPVSALIHSATMVAAGVFLVLRLFPVFEAAPLALDVMLWVGVLTALVAAVVATIQVDLKRVLAWSTVSQLGEMVIALGLAAPLAAAYHLVAHATFKSALFLTAGAVDHASGTRDLRRLGGLGRRLPLTAAAMVVSALALAGIPPFAGFWSEDHILSAMVHEASWLGSVLLLLILLAGFYIGRAVAAVLDHWPGAEPPDARHVSRTMQMGTVVMALAAATSGLVLALWGTALLPFPEEEAAALAWRIGAAVSGAAGLTGGWALVRIAGPAAPLSMIALPLEHAVELAVVIPARAVTLLAALIDRAEAALDTVARTIGASARGAALLVDMGEGLWDDAARASGAATISAAIGVEATEREGFGRGGDSFAAAFAQAGGGARQAQTGRLYLYTLSLFVWVGVAGLLSLLWWR